MSSSSNSIMDQISKTEETINNTFARIHDLEDKMLNESFSESKKKIIKQELIEMRKLLKSHEQQLAHLRTHNRKTFFIAVGLVFIIFAFYTFYILFLEHKQ